MGNYIALRDISTRRRHYAAGDVVDLTLLTPSEVEEVFERGQVLSEDVLSGTYARVNQGALQSRTCFLGDSITSAGRGQQDLLHCPDFPFMSGVVSSQRVFTVRNAGKAGDTSAQALARFDTDVTPYSPGTVVILLGTNDTGTSVALSTIISNLQAIVAKCKAIGARPVMCTIPPSSSGTPADRKARIIALNTWITRYAQINGITLIDFYTLLTDPSTGGYLSAYDSGDGVHPNATGYKAMATLVSSTLSSLLPNWIPNLPTWQDDGSNLIPDGLFLTNDGAGFPSAPWIKGGSYTGVTTSMVSGDTSIKGNWHKLTWAAAATGVPLPFVTSATAPVSGHIYAFAGRVDTSGFPGSGGADFTVKMRMNGGTTVDYVPLSACTQDLTGVFYIEGQAGPTNTGIQVSINFTIPGGGFTGGGYFRWAQLGIYDLTAMGIAPSSPMYAS